MRLRPIFGNAKMYYFTFKAVLRPKISIINNVLGFWLLFWWYVCHYICQRDSKWLLIIHYKKSLFSHHEKDLFVKSPTHTVSSTIFRKTTEVVALFNFYTVLRSHCAKHRLKFHETRQTSSKKKELTDTNSKGRYSLVIPTYVLTFEGIQGTFSMSVTSKQENGHIPQKSDDIFAFFVSQSQFFYPTVTIGKW